MYRLAPKSIAASEQVGGVRQTSNSQAAIIVTSFFAGPSLAGVDQEVGFVSGTVRLTLLDKFYIRLLCLLPGIITDFRTTGIS